MAEIKIKSPSEGILGNIMDIEKIAKEYELGGADVISAVTEEKLFGGNLGMIRKIKKSTILPILCKDFITTANQLNNVKMAGADAVLLIAFLLKKERLKSLYKESEKMELIPIVEVDNEKDLSFCIKQKFKTIAVNARNLRDFLIDRKKAIELLGMIPKTITSLAFSGVRNKEDVENYLDVGAKGILIGTTLMKSGNRMGFLRDLGRAE